MLYVYILFLFQASLCMHVSVSCHGNNSAINNDNIDSKNNNNSDLKKLQ